MDDVLRKMTEEKVFLEQEVQRIMESFAQAQDTIRALQGQNDELQEGLKAYRALGSIDQLGKIMDVTESMLENRPVEESEIASMQEALAVYEEFGTPEELNQVFESFEELMNQYKDLGTPTEVDEALERSTEILEAYKVLGNPEEIEEAFSATEYFMNEMAKLGTLEELHAVCDVLEAYQPFGTPSELAKAFDMMDRVVENTKKKHIQAEAAQISQKFGVTQDVAESLVEGIGGNKAREVLGAINEGRTVTSRYRINGNEGSINETRKGNQGMENMNEDAGTGPVSRAILKHNASSRATRMFEQFNR